MEQRGGMTRYSGARTWVGCRMMAALMPVALMMGLAACQPVRPVAELTPAPAATPAVVAVTAVVTVTAPAEATPTVVAEEAGTPAPATTEADEPVADDAVSAAGLAVYRQLYCGVCHMLDAAETHGTFGPTHNGMGAIAAARIIAPDYTGAATTAAGYIEESLLQPEVYVVPDYAMTSHQMPVYAHLTAEQLTALVAFLAAQ